ncbi:MAG: PEP-CTERM sorting domain-containing protein [Stellaceae bacterium]
MKKTGIAVSAAIAAAIATAGPAMATTIDFNGVSSSGNPILTTLTTQGFVFSSGHFHTVDNTGLCSFGGCVTGDGIYLAVDGPSLGFPIVMTKDGGGTFSLASADLAQMWNDDAAAAAGGFPNAANIEMIGSNGDIVTLSGASHSFQTQAAGGLLDNVTSVTFEGFGPADEADWSFTLDNIVVGAATTPTPEPATLAILSAGLLGFGLVRRRSRS